MSTYLLTSNLIELPGEAALECAGNWGSYCGKNPQPRWSGNYKASLLTPYDVRVPSACGISAAPTDLGVNDIDFDAETYWI